MKTLLLLLISISLPTLASTDEYTQEYKDSVVQAIVSSVEENILACIVTDKDGERLYGHDYNLKYLIQERYVMTVREGQQPVIVFKRGDMASRVQSVFKITTDENYKIVTKLDFRRVTRNKVGLENIGTIIEPKFVNKFEEKILTDQCVLEDK